MRFQLRQRCWNAKAPAHAKPRRGSVCCVRVRESYLRVTFLLGFCVSWRSIHVLLRSLPFNLVFFDFGLFVFLFVISCLLYFDFGSEADENRS